MLDFFLKLQKIKIKIRKNSRGVTLMELVITMALFAIASTFAVTMVMSINTKANGGLKTVGATNELKRAENLIENWFYSGSTTGELACEKVGNPSDESSPPASTQTVIDFSSKKATASEVLSPSIQIDDFTKDYAKLDIQNYISSDSNSLTFRAVANSGTAHYGLTIGGTNYWSGTKEIRGVITNTEKTISVVGQTLYKANGEKKEITAADIPNVTHFLIKPTQVGMSTYVDDIKIGNNYDVIDFETKASRPNVETVRSADVFWANNEAYRNDTNHTVNLQNTINNSNYSFKTYASGSAKVTDFSTDYAKIDMKGFISKNSSSFQFKALALGNGKAQYGLTIDNKNYWSGTKASDTNGVINNTVQTISVVGQTLYAADGTPKTITAADIKNITYLLFKPTVGDTNLFADDIEFGTVIDFDNNKVESNKASSEISSPNVFWHNTASHESQYLNSGDCFKTASRGERTIWSNTSSTDNTSLNSAPYFKVKTDGISKFKDFTVDYSKLNIKDYISSDSSSLTFKAVTDGGGTAQYGLTIGRANYWSGTKASDTNGVITSTAKEFSVVGQTLYTVNGAEKTIDASDIAKATNLLIKPINSSTSTPCSVYVDDITIDTRSTDGVDPLSVDLLREDTISAEFLGADTVSEDLPNVKLLSSTNESIILDWSNFDGYSEGGFKLNKDDPTGYIHVSGTQTLSTGTQIANLINWWGFTTAGYDKIKFTAYTGSGSSNIRMVYGDNVETANTTISTEPTVVTYDVTSTTSSDVKFRLDAGKQGATVNVDLYISDVYGVKAGSQEETTKATTTITTNPPDTSESSGLLLDWSDVTQTDGNIYISGANDQKGYTANTLDTKTKPDWVTFTSSKGNKDDLFFWGFPTDYSKYKGFRFKAYASEVVTLYCGREDNDKLQQQLSLSTTVPSKYYYIETSYIASKFGNITFYPDKAGVTIYISDIEWYDEVEVTTPSTTTTKSTTTTTVPTTTTEPTTAKKNEVLLDWSGVTNDNGNLKISGTDYGSSNASGFSNAEDGWVKFTSTSSNNKSTLFFWELKGYSQGVSNHTGVRFKAYSTQSDVTLTYGCEADDYEKKRKNAKLSSKKSEKYYYLDKSLLNESGGITFYPDKANVTIYISDIEWYDEEESSQIDLEIHNGYIVTLNSGTNKTYLVFNRDNMTVTCGNEKKAEQIVFSKVTGLTITATDTMLKLVFDVPDLATKKRTMLFSKRTTT